MAGYSTTSEILNSNLSPEEKIKMLQSQQNVNNNVNMLNMANKTDWQTMLGYGLGKMARNYVDNYLERGRDKAKQAYEEGQRLEKEGQNIQADWKDRQAINNAGGSVAPTPYSNPGKTMPGAGETTQSVLFNPNTGTVGLEKTQNFTSGLLGKTPQEMAMNEQFGKNLMGNIDGNALSKIPTDKLFGEIPTNAADVAMMTRGGAGAEGIMSNIAGNVGAAAKEAGDVSGKAGGSGFGDILGYIGAADKLAKGDTAGALKDGASTYLSTLGPWGMAASLALKLLG